MGVPVAPKGGRSPTTQSTAYLVIVRGPLGVGKTTVAQRLGETVGAEYVGIDRILDEHGLEEWESGFISQASFLRANGFVVDRVRASVAAGIPVVVDGNFYWKEAIRDLVHRVGSPPFIFTLSAPLDVCIARDRRRAESFGVGATWDVYAKTTSFEAGIAIDATRPLDAVVAEIRSHLPGGGHRV